MDSQEMLPNETTQWQSQGLPQLPPPAQASFGRTYVTQDDRLVAALAHASMWLNLITGFLGLAVAGGIWLVYRTRQRWVAGQALQAAFLQVVMILAIVLTGVAFGLGTTFWWTIIGLLFFPLACVAAVVPVVLFVYSLYGAFQVYTGRDFRYPLVGVVVDKP